MAHAASEPRAVGRDHRSCRSLRRRVIRQSYPRAGVGPEEVLLRWSERYFILAAEEPLGDAEDALRVLNGAPEFTHARRYGAHTAWRVRQPEHLADQLGVLLEHAGAEEIPVARYAWRRNLVIGSDAHRAYAQIARDRLRPVRHLAAETTRSVNDAQITRGVRLGGEPQQEGFRIPAGRRQHGYDVAGMCSLNVIPGTAVIPYEPASVCGHAPGHTHQLR